MNGYAKGSGYLKPTSVTWWAGVGLIVMGIVAATGWAPDVGSADAGVGGVINAVLSALSTLLGAGDIGSMSPQFMIVNGIGLIGIRKAIGAL